MEAAALLASVYVKGFGDNIVDAKNFVATTVKALKKGLLQMIAPRRLRLGTRLCSAFRPSPVKHAVLVASVTAKWL